MMKKKHYCLVMAVGLFSLAGSGAAISSPAKPLWHTEALTEVSELTELTKEGVPVEPGKKLEITFSARTSGTFTVEQNARIGIFNASKVASALSLQFFDPQGQRLEEINLPVVTESFHEYGRVVYPPAEAKSLRIFLVPAGLAELVVEKVRVTQDLEGVEAASVNPHPILRYGDLNAYGFGGRFFERPDGKTVWNTAFTGQTTPFPIEGGGSYELFGRGVGYSGKRSRIYLQLFKAGQKKPFHKISIKFSPEGESSKVVLPEETISANLLGYYAIVEELRITKTDLKN